MQQKTSLLGGSPPVPVAARLGSPTLGSRQSCSASRLGLARSKQRPRAMQVAGQDFATIQQPDLEGIEQ